MHAEIKDQIRDFHIAQLDLRADKEDRGKEELKNTERLIDVLVDLIDTIEGMEKNIEGLKEELRISTKRIDDLSIRTTPLMLVGAPLGSNH